MTHPNPEVPERAKRRSYSAKYKLEILADHEGLDRDGKGALLRREGLYVSLISEWRKQRDRGALEALAAKPGRAPVDPIERENSRLRQRVGRLEEELDTARRVIEVQGNSRRCWRSSPPTAPRRPAASRSDDRPIDRRVGTDGGYQGGSPWVRMRTR